MSTGQEFTLCSECILLLYTFLGFPNLDKALPLYIDASIYKQLPEEYYDARIKELEIELFDMKRKYDRRMSR
jgi:hypothetical protein